MMNGKKVIYLETSVVNHFFETREDLCSKTAKALYAQIIAGKYVVVSSVLTIKEIEKIEIKSTMSPEIAAELKEKKENMLGFLNSPNIFILADSTDVDELAQEYYKTGKLMYNKEFDDLKHIALATLSSIPIDILFSNNFQHIIRKETFEMVAKVNEEKGYDNFKIIKTEEIEQCL